MPIDLNTISTKPPKDWSRSKAKKHVKTLRQEIGEYQEKLYAEAKTSILIVLQGMDGSGKDGLVRDLFSAIPAYGINVKSFKKPTEEEAAHDFLWRVRPHIPAKGMIQVFNRSYYEDILVPAVMKHLPETQIESRFESINNLERTLMAEGIHILKIYLHISKEEQKLQLLERTTDPGKYWKHSDGDWKTREHWDEFRLIYNRILNECATPPWHIIPVDEKWCKLQMVGDIFAQLLKEINPQYPPLQSELFK